MKRLSLLPAVAGLMLTARALPGAPAALEDTLILPAKTPPAGKAFAILATGDGGWAELDRELAGRLAASDLPVVGWNSRSYYWTRRTPEEASADLAALIRRFREAWHRPRVVLIGFSRGADVMPFLVSRLPRAEREGLDLIALLGPGQTIDFQFHLLDLVHTPGGATALPVPPELEKLRGLPMLILYGDKDDSSCGAALPVDLGRIIRLPGDHHLGRDYDRISRIIRETALAGTNTRAPNTPVDHPRPGSDDAAKPSTQPRTNEALKATSRK